MPRFLPVTHLGLVFEDDYLLVSAVSLRGSHNLCPVNKGLTRNCLLAIGDEQHPVQLNGFALSYIQKLHVYSLALGYFILLSASFNDSVNLSASQKCYSTSFGGRLSNGRVWWLVEEPRIVAQYTLVL